MSLILASGSPRRQQMLRDLNLRFLVKIPSINEKRKTGEHPIIYVRRMAKEKAEEILSHIENRNKDFVILSADTIVVYQSLVLGKPKTPKEALKMLLKLSGRSHEVITAFSWLGRSKHFVKTKVESIRTKVRFAHRPRSFWKWYVSTGEPMDKAGAYAAQGIGMSFIENVSGSYSNVVGLPLSHVLESYSSLFGADLREHFRKLKKN